VDLLSGIGKFDLTVTGVDWIYKALFSVIIVGYLLYVFLVSLRIRILVDSAKTNLDKYIRFSSYVHLLVALVGSFISIILILLG